MPQSAPVLEGRVALGFGAGSFGPRWGNGKAAAVAYARVPCVDLKLERAQETSDIIAAEQGRGRAIPALAEVALDVAQTWERGGLGQRRGTPHQRSHAARGWRHREPAGHRKVSGIA